MSNSKLWRMKNIQIGLAIRLDLLHVKFYTVEWFLTELYMTSTLRTWKRHQKPQVMRKAKFSFLLAFCNGAKAAFGFRLRVGSKSGFEELNQSQSGERALWLFYPSAAASDSDNLVFARSEANVSDGVVSGVGRNGKVLILLTPIPSRLWLRLRLRLRLRR